jgi:hypothetical protein
MPRVVAMQGRSMSSSAPLMLFPIMLAACFALIFALVIFRAH